MKSIIICLLKRLASIPFWLLWVVLTIIGLIMGGLLDAVWTFIDSVRDVPGLGALWKRVFPPHKPWGLISWIWDNVTDLAAWIMDKFECQDTAWKRWRTVHAVQSANSASDQPRLEPRLDGNESVD